MFEILNDKELNKMMGQGEEFKRPMKPSKVLQYFRKPKGFDDLPFRDRQRIVRETAETFNKYRTLDRPALAKVMTFGGMTASVSVRLSSIAYQASLRRCGAKRKRDGKPCRHKLVDGSKRCKFHGGLSTGPRTLDGMRKALSCLPQYKANPEALETRLAVFAAEQGQD